MTINLITKSRVFWQSILKENNKQSSKTKNLQGKNMVMQKRTIFLSYLFATSFIYSGTLFHTLVQTPDGLKEIQDLSIGTASTLVGSALTLCLFLP